MLQITLEIKKQREISGYQYIQTVGKPRKLAQLIAHWDCVNK